MTEKCPHRGEINKFLVPQKGYPHILLVKPESSEEALPGDIPVCDTCLTSYGTVNRPADCTFINLPSVNPSDKAAESAG